MAVHGRRRKVNVIRDTGGKSRGEPQIVHPETIAVRLRELRRCGVPVRDRHAALDALAGFTLGRLLLRHRADVSDPGSINEQQYDAGQEWAKLVYRHAIVMGYSLGSPKSPSFILVGAGLSCAQEPNEQEIIVVRRRWSDCYRALMETCKTHGLGCVTSPMRFASRTAASISSRRPIMATFASASMLWPRCLAPRRARAMRGSGDGIYGTESNGSVRSTP